MNRRFQFGLGRLMAATAVAALAASACAWFGRRWPVLVFAIAVMAAGIAIGTLARDPLNGMVIACLVLGLLFCIVFGALVTGLLVID